MTELIVRLFVKDYQDLKSPAVHTRYGQVAGGVGLVCNLLLAAAKLLAGILSGSLAITADAVNNFSDAASSVITLIGFKLSAKPADDEHPFGHARFEYIAGLAVAVMVMVIGLELGKGSIQKIFAPTPVDFGLLSIIILAVSIAVKLWMALFNRRIGRRIGSKALEATFADSRNDVISTSVVLLAALVARFTGLQLDGWMGAAVALFILVSGGMLVKETLDPLLGAATDAELVKYVSDKIASHPGVLGTHDLIVHDYGPGRRFASAHVEMDASADVLESHEMIDTIEREFIAEDNIHLIIHYDPIDTSATATEARQELESYLKALDGRISMHDFRMVDGARHINYIFDVVLPRDFEITKEELQRKVESEVRKDKLTVHAHITVDNNFTSAGD